MLLKQLSFSAQQLNALLSRLQQQVGFVFLDSASNQHENSQFSVIAWQPKYLIEADLNNTKVTQNKQLIEETTDDPLQVIQKYINLAGLSDSELPFSGGAIGYFDYELGGRFETLPQPKDDDIDLANMTVGIYDTVIVINHKTDVSTFVSQSENANQDYEYIAKLLSDEAQPVVSSFSLTTAWSSNMTQAQYTEKFNQVQAYLLAGDCYQINLAQRFSAGYEGDEWQAYSKLREVNAAPFSSFIRVDNGAVLSVSPERFLQVENGNIETKPIKGTRPRSQDIELDKRLADELKSADKDRAENLMIVDLLRNDLSKVAVPGTVEVPKLFAIESFPAVHHLVSTVTAKIREPFNSLDLLRGAFPGGSITGAPKIRAMQIIHELEPNNRSVYCGAIGYIKPNGDMDTNITIRTLVCNQGQIHCWAGGGLVADSNAQSEYQETLDKVNKILPVLENGTL